MKKVLFMGIMALAISVSSQTQPLEIQLPNGIPFLLGEITEKNLKTGNYGDWYTTNYKNYAVDQSLVQLFQKELAQHQVLLFLGTWCGDSKRQVPRMLKILDAANFPKEQLTMIALDRRKEHYKKGPNGEEKGWNIKRVPTLILLKDGIEINRIVERPIDTLEEDLLAILQGMEYIPNYTN